MIFDGDKQKLNIVTDTFLHINSNLFQIVSGKKPILNVYFESYSDNVKLSRFSNELSELACAIQTMESKMVLRISYNYTMKYSRFISNVNTVAKIKGL